LITVGIGMFTLTFDRAPSWGWATPGTIIAFVASVAVLAAFVIVENKVRRPLVDLSLFRNARFTILVAAGTVANIAYTVTIYLSTVNLQQVRGLSPLMAGVAFLGPMSGRLAAKYPPVRVMGIACIAAALSRAALAVSRGWTGYLIALAAYGFTMGLVYAFTTVATQAVVRPERGRRGGRGADGIGHAGRCRCRGVRHGPRNAHARRHVHGQRHRGHLPDRRRRTAARRCCRGCIGVP
jgi:hypothetical protein